MDNVVSRKTVKEDKFRPIIATGVDTFEELVEQSSTFVDKSLFIKAFWENNNKTVLTTYPRRSGKSMNMRMVQSFFRIEVDDKGVPLTKEKKTFTKYFSGGNIKLKWSKKKFLAALKIGRDPDMMIEHGKYPVIYLDVKSCNGDFYDEIFDTIRECLWKCFANHEYLLQSEKISNGEKARLRKYIDASDCDHLSKKDVCTSLSFLSALLYKHFDKKVIILIDEYDAPINKAYMQLSEEEFQKVIRLFREIYGAALKNNDYLAKALVTGVMRIAKANIFSGLNNLGEYNVTSTSFSKYYGFTQEEVDMLVNYYSISSTISKEIKNWYNGYKIGKYEIYNIWSVIKCINEYCDLVQDELYRNNSDLLKEEILRSYWEESGNVDFVKKLFKWDLIKRKIDKLVSGQAITFTLHNTITSDCFRILKEVMGLSSNYKINEHVVDILFSYLTMGGYLTFAAERRGWFKLPNHEITHEFRARLRSYYKVEYPVPTESFLGVTDMLNGLNLTSSV